MSDPDTSCEFEASEWLRYTRHIQLPGFGVDGQLRLKQSSVLVIGCGGLGSPLLFYLAAAGVGQLTLVDGDSVDLTNLQRQVLYTEADVGLPKAEVAARRLLALNSNIEVAAHSTAFGASAEEGGVSNLGRERALVEAHDLVVDCTDNFASRYLINDLCAEYEKPWVYASIFQFSGQCALFEPAGPCFRCLFPESPTGLPDCNVAGVLGVLPGLLGTLQANEVLKYLAGLSTPLVGKLLLVEALDLEFRRIELQGDPACPVCYGNKADQGASERVEESANARHRSEPKSDGTEMSVDAFANLTEDGFTLLDVRSDAERQAFHIGGEHIVLAELAEGGSGLPKASPIICYCQSGQRSLDAARMLCEAGYSARSLAGGLAAWLQYQQAHRGNTNNQ